MYLLLLTILRLLMILLPDLDLLTVLLQILLLMTLPDLVLLLTILQDLLTVLLQILLLMTLPDLVLLLTILQDLLPPCLLTLLVTYLLTILVLMIQVLPAWILVFLFLLISDIEDLPLTPMNPQASLIPSFMISLDPMSVKIFLTEGESFLEHSSLHATATMEPAGSLAKSFSSP